MDNIHDRGVRLVEANLIYTSSKQLHYDFTFFRTARRCKSEECVYSRKYEEWYPLLSGLTVVCEFAISSNVRSADLHVDNGESICQSHEDDQGPNTFDAVLISETWKWLRMQAHAFLWPSNGEINLGGSHNDPRGNCGARCWFRDGCGTQPDVR